MKRYLLFDAGCKRFSDSAEAITKETGGKLSVRSLRDPAMKELLDRERPGWKWEPMLVEEKDDKVRIYAGAAMSRRLLLVLGPRRALKVIRFMSGTTPFQDISTGRREFMKKVGVSALSLFFLPSLGRNDGIAKAWFNSKSPQIPPIPDKKSIAINVTMQSSTFRQERNKLNYSVVMPHPENDNVMIVVHSDADIYSDVMPSRALITFVELGTQKVLLSAPISISASDRGKYAVSIRDEYREGTFILAQQGSLVSQRIIPLKDRDSQIEQIAPMRIGDPTETGCNKKCICGIVCGSIGVWYCPLVGIAGGPIAGLICSIIFVVLCSWMCQSVREQSPYSRSSSS